MRTFDFHGHPVGAIGLGCMGMSWAYGPADRDESLRTLHRALELGVDFWDTADVYGPEENERLLAEVLRTRRNDVFLCTKFANVYDRTMTSHQDQVADEVAWIVDGTPEYVKKCCDLSLQRLGIDTIDLYYMHRVDPKVPIEETVGAMADLVRAGKVRHLGLSEASADSIRRAVAVHPIAALQSEYSLWTRDYEHEVIPLTRELGITFVPYSPLGRGFLTGAIGKIEDLDETDYRRQTPRFSEENFEKNLELAERVKAVATRKDATPAQVALAWTLAAGDHVLPIPGTKRVKYLEENAAASQLELTSADLEDLGDFAVAGERYSPMGMKYING